MDAKREYCSIVPFFLLNEATRNSSMALGTLAESERFRDLLRCKMHD